ncbi:MAG: class I SAM-dependent methyltransferase [Burkholderiaceae bacterium]
MSTNQTSLPVIEDELDLLAELVPLAGQHIIELGCGAAKMARALLLRYRDSDVTGVEIDARQHAKNLAAPQERLNFVSGVAQDIPGDDGRFDLALMLKSLHHVPVAAMAQALSEVARVLRPGGQLYISEPVFDGALNHITRLYNDEQVVRAAAQAAIDVALSTGTWAQVQERRFAVPSRFADFAAFELRMIGQTYANHQLDAVTMAEVRSRFEAKCGADGAVFEQPMHVRLLRRSDQ